VRALSAFERAYASEIFAASLDYAPIAITRDSLISVGAPKTLGNTVHLRSHWGRAIFDDRRAENALTQAGLELLIHELGHVWQYQNAGVAYVGDSLWAQLKGAVLSGSRSAAYNWQAALSADTPWNLWNPEQQASAIEAYNRALRKSSDHPIVAALQPVIDKVRAGEGAPTFSVPGAVAGGLSGAGAGALVGLPVGGPVGAALGATAGGVLGALFLGG